MHQTFIVGIDEHQAVLAGEVAVQLRHRPHHPFETPEALKVRASHVGDKAAVGVGNTAEELYLPRVVGAHLHDDQLRPLGNGQQRQRHTQMVVEVALGCRSLVALGQHGMHQLLGGGLTVGAGDAYEGHLQMAAVLARQLLQRFQHIGHHDAAVVDLVILIANNAQRGPLLQRLRCESVAVEVLALEGEEDAAMRDIP